MRPTTYTAADTSKWPESIRSFWEGGEPERFGVSGAGGERVDYMRRVENPQGRPEVDVYRRDLGGVSMAQLSTQLRETRQLVDSIDTQDLRRGFTLTLLLLLGAAALSLLPLVLIAPRRRDPAVLTLTDFAGGLVAAAGDRSAAGSFPAGRSGARRSRVQYMADQLEEAANGSCT